MDTPQSILLQTASAIMQSISPTTETSPSLSIPINSLIDNNNARYSSHLLTIYLYLNIINQSPYSFDSPISQSGTTSHNHNECYYLTNNY